MGYPLYREVKVWAPPSLTHREKLTAMVLADDANDTTRLTWSSVVDPEILRQAMLKTDRDMRKVLARLQAEKVIEHAGGGHNGKVAKYRFIHLDPDGCPGKPDCECPLALEGQKGPATDGDVDGVGGPKNTGYTDIDTSAPVQKGPPTDGVGGPNRHRSRSKKDLPTPPTSSTTSSTAPAGKPAGGQRKPNRHQVADDLTAAFWDHHGKGRAQPFIAVRSIIRTAISNGVDRDQLARALDAVAREGRSVSGATLDIALGKLRGANGQPRGGARSDIPSHDDWDNDTVEVKL